MLYFLSFLTACVIYCITSSFLSYEICFFLNNNFLLRPPNGFSKNKDFSFCLSWIFIAPSLTHNIDVYFCSSEHPFGLAALHILCDTDGSGDLHQLRAVGADGSALRSCQVRGP